MSIDLCINFSPIKDEYFAKLISNPMFKDDKKINEIVELLDTDVDYLLFSDDEIKNNFDNVEYIVSIKSKEKYLGKEIIVLPNNHSQYKKLMNFQIIGKLYFKCVRNE